MGIISCASLFGTIAGNIELVVPQAPSSTHIFFFLYLFITDT